MSFGGAFGANKFGGGTPTSALQKSSPADIEVAQSPSDAISGLAWSPQADYLAASSWDNQVRIYEVGANGQTAPKAAFSHEGPVLSVTWNKDGTKVLSGGIDKAGRCYDVNTGQATQVAAHAEPIKKVNWIDAGGTELLATGSWDKTVKYWDLRQQNPALTVQVPQRVYSMDVRFPLLVVACADRYIDVFDLRKPDSALKKNVSSLKWQTRVVSCFTDGVGYAIGSIEGRVGIQYIEKTGQQSDFSFRCHRTEAANKVSMAYPVNDISFHPVHGTFCTAGSDGSLIFWDHTAKQRLQKYDGKGGPITCTSFNRTGNILAYALSYDWSQGHSGNQPNIPNKIMLHACVDEDVKKKQQQRK